MRHLSLQKLILAALVITTAQLAAAGETATDAHAQHRHMMSADAGTSIKLVEYTVPDLQLVDASDGRQVALRDVINPGKPVIVNFIFTTCTTICPVITATTLQLQKEFDADDLVPQFVTISIDPDYDSAEVMREYAQRYGADWTFLTGSANNIMTTLQAFDAYRGNKVNHFALNIMRAAGDQQWTRVEGLSSASELAKVWRGLAQ